MMFRSEARSSGGARRRRRGGSTRPSGLTVRRAGMIGNGADVLTRPWYPCRASDAHLDARAFNLRLRARGSAIGGCCSSPTLRGAWEVEVAGACGLARVSGRSAEGACRVGRRCIAVGTPMWSGVLAVQRYETSAEGVSDLLVEELVVAVDAVGVGGEQDVGAVAGAGGDLGGFAARVQPQREAAWRRS
jgi:hypothetical protein